MRSLHAAEPQFPGDDGAADPAVVAALTAYAAGRGSEHAALTALSGSRLLVPVVAMPTEEAGGDSETADEAANVPGAGLRQEKTTERREKTTERREKTTERREKTTEMALPTLIGRDGRSAVLAFTSLDALTRWRPDARPVAVPAARAWQAGAEGASAVVIDVAGPVPVTVEGARLAALAAGRPAPLPHQDPDVLAALHAALADEPLIVQASLTTPDQRAGWEHGPRPEDLPDLAARSGAGLSALALDLAGPARGGAGPDGAGQDSAPGGAASEASAGGGPVANAADSAGASHDVAGPDAVTQDAAAKQAAAKQAAAEDAAAHGPAAQETARQDTGDLALQVTLSGGCDPAAATAAVRRVAEALLTATGGRLRRGMEVSVAPPRPAGRAR